MPGIRDSMNACMVAYAFYENDTRVIRYAETLVEHGHCVDAIVLRRKDQSRCERIRGVNICRIQGREGNEKSASHHLLRLTLFFIRSFFYLTRLHLKSAYDLVHVHSVPDFEVFAALIPKFRGAKIILDIHDIIPEFYTAKFGTSTKSVIFKMLAHVERLSCAFADHVIIANDIWKERLQERSVAPAKCTALINYPDTQLFRPRGVKKASNGNFLILYPGSLSWHQGLDIAIRAYSAVKDALGEAEFHIYGEGSSKESLKELVRELGLERRVLFKESVSASDIAEIMAGADLGVVPKRADLFGDEAFSTKIVEFMAVGVPVVVSRTKVDTRYFDDSLVIFFEPGNEEDLAEKLIRLRGDPELRRGFAQRALRWAEANSWNTKKAKYIALVDSLVGRQQLG